MACWCCCCHARNSSCQQFPTHVCLPAATAQCFFRFFLTSNTSLTSHSATLSAVLCSSLSCPALLFHRWRLRLLRLLIDPTCSVAGCPCLCLLLFVVVVGMCSLQQLRWVTSPMYSKPRMSSTQQPTTRVEHALQLSGCVCVLKRYCYARRTESVVPQIHMCVQDAFSVACEEDSR